jgi:Tol biopolymer transport system component
MPKGELTEWGKPGRFWTVRPDGSALAPLTAEPRHDYNPAWSPDGAALLIDANRDGGWAAGRSGRSAPTAARARGSPTTR